MSQAWARVGDGTQTQASLHARQAQAPGRVGYYQVLVNDDMTT